MMLNDLLIREAGPADFDLIRDIAHRTWPHTFQGILSPEQIDYMLGLMYTQASLEMQLQAGHIFLLLFSQGQELGFTSFQPDFPSMGESKLHKIYLLPSAHGKGCGKLLINEVIRRIRMQNQQSVRLNVHRHNNAVQFYEKLGFTIIGEADIDIGEGYLANDFIMKKELNPVLF